MKPVYLEFCGINSFSESAKIDFEKLLSGGIFGIFGDPLLSYAICPLGGLKVAWGKKYLLVKVR
ncbi:MAG: hypothetical protein IIX01_06085, partial [Clostridia bacterium]|nr:hypothetical protein [Clostridia bacterium]